MGFIPIPGGGVQLPDTFGQQTAGDTSEATALAAEEEAQRQKGQEDAEKRKRALRAIYGDGFPLALDYGGEPPTENDWQRWVEERWEHHTPGIQQNAWVAERNRQFRAGVQYQSRINASGAWREVPTPKDAVRIVDNRIRPALAWQLQVVSEQRPGWTFKPTSTDADRERKAEAMQRAVEYQYDVQEARKIIREALFWAQSDGVSFAMTYWDPDKGPWEELEQDKGPEPLGEPCTKVYRLEQVRVSSEATSTVKPMYWIIRDILPLQQAVALYGPDVLGQEDQALLSQQASQFTFTNQYAYTPLYMNEQTVARFTVFCEKSPWLQDGLTLIQVGRKTVYGPTGLLMGRVPMVRFTDGSEDPAFFPNPRMSLLVGPQMRINQLWSKWYESIRKNSGGRYATKTNAIVAETFIGGETSILEVRTAGDIRESLMPVQSFSVGNDIKEALDRETKIIEDLTGYNDEARGQFSTDQSGRAILAQREQLERVFAPTVTSIAEGMVEWARQMVGWMRFGYQMPRQIAIQGKNRTDLAIAISSMDMDGIVDVSVDPETLTPQPKALRQWLLDNAYDRQLITKDQWLERAPFGNVRDMQTPSEVQYSKAKRVSEQLRRGEQPEPVVWQDDEAINQNVLERDLILAAGTPPQVVQAAQQRWQQLAQQQQQKRGPQAPAPDSPEGKYQKFIGDITNDTVNVAERLISDVVQNQTLMNAGVQQPAPPPEQPVEGGGGAPPKGQPLSPAVQPSLGSSPSVSAGPLSSGPRTPTAAV